MNPSPVVSRSHSMEPWPASAAPPPPGDALPLVTPGRLRDLAESFGGDAGLPVLRELIVMYRAETRPRLAQLARAWADGENIVARHEAHFLAGSSANLGLERLAAWLREIEAQTRADHLPEMPNLNALLETRWAESCAAYESALDNLAPRA